MRFRLPMTHVLSAALLLSSIACSPRVLAQTTTPPTTSTPTPTAGPAPTLPAPPPPPARAPWVEPHPEIAYLPKPPAVAADFIVEHPPVTPNASPEAKALLHMLYTISGKNTMSGQHNGQAGVNTEIVTKVIGKNPAVYGQDWGFGQGASAHRHDLVKDIIQQWQTGHVIALCWHEVPPTMDEPVQFRGQIQSRITEQEFNDLLTPGTPIYKHWCTQIDGVAECLKELQDAHVPILWRPLHEINGDWFWWNGVRGDDSHGSKQLYRQVFDRLVNYHKLTNLIWVWNPDRPERADRQFVDYFPGIQYCDVLSLDCYNVYKQSYYDDLNALSEGKVLSIAETYVPPDLDIYATQPKWAYYMRWSVNARQLETMMTNHQEKLAADSIAGVAMRSDQPVPPNALTGDQLRAMLSSPRMLNLGDKSYKGFLNPVREASGLRKMR